MLCQLTIAISIAPCLLASCAPEVSAQCSAESHVRRNAKYWLANRKSQHLGHVKDAFSRLGYGPANSAGDDWSIMWAFHSPFHPREGEPDIPQVLQSLKPGQMVNQLPGASAFTSKMRLAAQSGKLQFLPRSFPLTKNVSDIAAYQAHHPDAEWLLKGAQHRGIEVLSSLEEGLLRSREVDGELGAFAQQLIRPYLIDGKLWDMGLYVAVTSVNPLRAYVYDNLLLRHCTQDYVEDLSEAPLDAFVVAENYAPPWAIPALRSYFARGMSTANVLRSYLFDEGLDFEAILSQMKEHVVRLLLYFEPHLRASALEYPHGARSFFGMYRFDFLLDRDLKPWLIEVNQSPNLSSSATADLRNMFQRISFSLLSLLGFGHGQLRHPDNPEDHLEIIGHHNDVDIGWRVCTACVDSCEGDCRMCRRCRTPEQTQMIRELISEARNRQAFQRLIPLDARMASRPALTSLSSATENDELMRLFVREKCQTDPSWC